MISAHGSVLGCSELGQVDLHTVTESTSWANDNLAIDQAQDWRLAVRLFLASCYFLYM